MTFLNLKRLGKSSLLASLMVAQAAFAGTLTNVSVTPTDATPGATTTYTFQYTLDSDVNADEALFYVTFPDGPGEFSVATGACDRIVSITVTPSPGLTICRGSYGSGNTVGFAVSTTVSGGVSVPGGSIVEIVVAGVTNPAMAGDYDFDDGAGTGIITTQMMDPMFPMVTPKDIASQQTVTIGGASPVNGTCGTSGGVGQVFSTTNPPSGNLCATGSASTPNLNSVTYEWTCSSTGGGTTASCSAALGYDLTLSISPPSGGSVLCTSNPVIHGGNTSCDPTPSTGYSFVNWSGDCSGATCALNNVTSSGFNLQANFAINQYTITKTVNPITAGSITCTNDPVDHGDDSTCTYTANAGYTFTNWSEDCTGATCALVGITEDKDVTANFTAPTYTITVNTSGSGTASCTPNPVTGGSNATCTASPSVGNSFTGWSGDCTGSSCAFTSMSANKTITANFATATYTLSGSASPSAGGSVSCSGSVSHGGNGSCTASANTGYTFTGWSSCPSASGTSCSFTNVTSSQSVTANFTINSYTVTAVASPIDAGSASCTSPVNHGSSASCTANAAAGYRLASWSGACTGSSCSIASVTANSSVTATFELLPTYNISTSVTPADSGKITCTKDIMEGGNGTCMAKTNDGYRFTGWGGDCSGTTASCSLVNVTSAKSVTASFEAASQFTITASRQSVQGSVSGLTVGGEVQCSATNPVTEGATVSCTYTHGSIRGWAGDCTRVEGDRCIIENIATDKHIQVLTGTSYARAIEIYPAGAGSVWCEGLTKAMSLSGFNSNCVGQANPGYKFVSATESLCAECFTPVTVHVNFEKLANTPVVACDGCTNSTTSTDTTTTITTSKTSEPDAQGNTTQSTVAVTKDTSGVTNTSIIVTGQTSGSAGPLNQLTVAGTNSTVTVGDGGNTNVVFGSGGSSSTIELSAGGVSGTLGSSAEFGSTVFNAKSTSGTMTDVYDFEDNSGSGIIFTKPVSIKLPVDKVDDIDTDLLTLAKIINSKLEYYGGKYNSEGKYFEQDRKSFKPHAKPAADNSFAFISASWSANVNSNLVMEGTEQNTVTQHTVTLADKSAVELKTVVGITDKIVTTTLKMSTGETASDKGVTGKLNAGFAAIKVDGGATNGSFSIADKQVSADDQRQVTLAVNNGELNSIELTDVNGSQTFFIAASEGAPAVTGFESSAESFSVTLSYPATK